MTHPPLIMGILNVTPDSFSGDGLLQKEDYIATALKQAEAMIQEGADCLDIGGESTRPGSRLVSENEETARVCPVISALRARFPHIPLSIDTMKAAVLEEALKCGATIANDVTGEAQDDTYFRIAARYEAQLILMHNAADTARTTPIVSGGSAYEAPEGGHDSVQEVIASLALLTQRALACGVKPDKIILDPGLGFGKTLDDNYRLVRTIPTLKQAGYPVLIGGSRKSFIGQILNVPPPERIHGSASLASVATFLGADILRVHDVKATSHAVKIAAQIRGGSGTH